MPANDWPVHSVKSARASDWLALNVCHLMANGQCTTHNYNSKDAQSWRCMPIVDSTGLVRAQVNKQARRASRRHKTNHGREALRAAEGIFRVSLNSAVVARRESAFGGKAPKRAMKVPLGCVSGSIGEPHAFESKRLSAVKRRSDWMLRKCICCAVSQKSQTSALLYVHVVD